ncbi:perilipin-2-like [Stigmatopora argus]
MSLNKQPAVTTRLAQLPLVRSAFANLSEMYGDTKSSIPAFRSVSEGLEGGVTLITSVACQGMSPVITKLKPQVSIVNDVACKSLDWLEEKFPVLQTSTDQLVAGFRSKALEMQDAVSIVAHGTVDCVQYAVRSIMARDKQPDDRSLIGRAASVSSKGLDSALNMSEALVDRMLPPLEEEKKEEDILVADSEEVTLGRKYSVRLVTLSITLCRRTIQLAGSKMQSAEIMAALSTSSDQLRILQTSWMALTWGLERFPLHVQEQIVSALFYFTQRYNLRVAPQRLSNPESGECVTAKVAAITQTPPKGTWDSPQRNPNWRARRPASMSVIERRSTQSLGKEIGPS